MKNILMFLFFLPLAFSSQIATPGIEVWGANWHSSLDSALIASQNANKLILMYCRESMDQNCAFVEENLFSSEAISANLNKFIILKLDVRLHKGILKKYGIAERANMRYQYSPELWILDGFGDVIYPNIWDEFLRESEYKAIDAQAMKEKTCRLLENLPANVKQYHDAKRKLLQSENPETLIQVGEALFANRILDLSNRYFQKAFRKLRWNGNVDLRLRAQSGMAINFIGLQKHNKAIKLFKKILLKTKVGDSRREIWLSGLAKSYLLKNDSKKAKKILDQLRAEFPDSELLVE